MMEVNFSDPFDARGVDASLEVLDRDGLLSAVHSQMRQRFLTESYYAATVVLGYRALRPRTHAPICRFIDTCTATRQLLQDPRSHFKTTIKTVTNTIQKLLRRPGLRVLIVGDTDTNAEKHVGKIKNQFERNALLRWLFPDLLWANPDTEAPGWTKRELFLKHRLMHGEPSLVAFGAGSAVVSWHFDYIGVDDLIADDEYLSESEMAKTIEWSTGLESLFALDEPIDKKELHVVGTYWKTNDAYAHIEKYFGGKAEPVKTGPHSYQRGTLAVFRRSARDENGEPIFPEAISKTFLDRLQQMNPERYAAQYANNPYDAATAYFKKEYLKFYTWAIANRIINIRHGDGRFERIRVDELEVYSFCDPHAGGPKKVGRFQQGGRAAVITTGTHGPTGRVIILDCCIKRMPTDKLITEIIRQNEQWDPVGFLVEANGLQKMIKPWLDERINREDRMAVPYVPFIPKGDKDGDRRIKGLQPLARAGQFYLQEGFTELIEEFQSWPNGLKDGLDCLSQGLTKWGVGFEAVEDEVLEERERWIRSQNSTVTGY